MKMSTFLDHNDQAEIKFPESSDAMALNDRWCSFLKSRADNAKRHSFDYSINEEDLYKDGHGIEMNKMPCIVRDGCGSGMIKFQGEGVAQFSGVTTSFSYRGASGSVFAFHREDMRLYSINVLLSGRPKLWYIVPPAWYDRTLKLIKEELVKYDHYSGTGCAAMEMHKDLFINPDWFDRKQIPLYALVQNPGQAVIVEPLALHQGVNTGLNFALATNFGTPDWLEYAMDAPVVSDHLCLH